MARIAGVKSGRGGGREAKRGLKEGDWEKGRTLFFPFFLLFFFCLHSPPLPRLGLRRRTPFLQIQSELCCQITLKRTSLSFFSRNLLFQVSSKLTLSSLLSSLYFLDRCYKRRYISATLNIRALMEKQDRKLFSKILKLSILPLHKQVPKAKVIDYNLRYKNSARTLINTERFKNTFINRLTYKYDLHM